MFFEKRDLHLHSRYPVNYSYLYFAVMLQQKSKELKVIKSKNYKKNQYHQLFHFQTFKIINIVTCV